MLERFLLGKEVDKTAFSIGKNEVLNEVAGQIHKIIRVNMYKAKEKK